MTRASGNPLTPTLSPATRGRGSDGRHPPPAKRGEGRGGGHDASFWQPLHPNPLPRNAGERERRPTPSPREAGRAGVGGMTRASGCPLTPTLSPASRGRGSDGDLHGTPIEGKDKPLHEIPDPGPLRIRVGRRGGAASKEGGAARKTGGAASKE